MSDDAGCCQICLEQVDAAQLLTGEQLCLSQCSARVCRACLRGHVRAALDSCYAGVLPRVRCPICLARLPKSQWSALADADGEPELARRYANFCQRACSLQAPCCHKIGYTHLPDFDAKSEHPAVDSAQPLVHKTEANTAEKQPEPTASPNDDVTAVADATTTTSEAVDTTTDRGDDAAGTTLEDQLKLEFFARCREFCFHRAESRAVVQFVLDQFQDPKRAEAVLEEALARIADDERRAALLLSFLYLRPAATTRCCRRAFCFNCKRNGHHSTCEGEAIDISSCVAQCRSCCVMIVKVEGCDSVSCVCGFTMSWGNELAIQTRNRRQLIAVDIFDRALYDRWEAWRTKIRGWAPMFQQKLEVRRKRVLLRQYLPMLRRRFSGYIWWFRAYRKREQLQREVFWEVYARAHPGEMASEFDECMSGLLAIKTDLTDASAPAAAVAVDEVPVAA